MPCRRSSFYPSVPRFLDCLGIHLTLLDCQGEAEENAHERAEKLAARIAGALLFALAAYVALASAMSLLGYSEPKPTLIGIVVLTIAAAVMPWLAREKRRLSATAGSAALRADASESALCAYLSVIALMGLAINAIWHLRWADPVAALVILPVMIWEGREAMHGKPCGCC